MSFANYVAPGINRKFANPPQRNRSGPSCGAASTQVGANDFQFCHRVMAHVFSRFAFHCVPSSLNSWSCRRFFDNLLGTPSFLTTRTPRPPTISMSVRSAVHVTVPADVLLLSLIGRSTH